LDKLARQMHFGPIKELNMSKSASIDHFQQRLPFFAVVHQ